MTTPDRRQIRRFLPIAVYLSGLPEFEDLAPARQGATFARRCQTTILRPATEDELTHALQMFVTEGWLLAEDNGRTGHVYMDPEAQHAITDICHGEPFLFQLAGSAACGFPAASNTGTFTRRRDRVRGILGRGKPYTFRRRATEAFLTSEWPYMDDTER